METDPRLAAAAEAAGIELLPWQAEVGTRWLAGESFVWQPGSRRGRWALRKLIDDVRARENAGSDD